MTPNPPPRHGIRHLARLSLFPQFDIRHCGNYRDVEELFTSPAMHNVFFMKPSVFDNSHVVRSNNACKHYNEARSCNFPDCKYAALRACRCLFTLFKGSRLRTLLFTLPSCHSRRHVIFRNSRGVGCFRALIGMALMFASWQ